MNVVFIGDVYGSPGRNVLSDKLPRIREIYSPDAVVVNGENAAGGNGLTPAVAEELFSLGVDVLTSGNHIWDKREIMPYMDQDSRILRPSNYPPGVPGKGSGVYQARNGNLLGVINVSGRVFLPQAFDCPFRALDKEISKIRELTPFILVDFHAEATSEKIAAGYYVDGRVSAFVGTHTHVQTADETILPGGTAYLTDAGMTGSREGVIGVKKDIILRRFLTQLPARHVPSKGHAGVSGVFIEISSSGKASAIERISLD